MRTYDPYDDSLIIHGYKLSKLTESFYHLTEHLYGDKNDELDAEEIEHALRNISSILEVHLPNKELKLCYT